ncbi:MAG TPA: hypothetical protein VFL95_12150 [Gemmatimonadales bacterium]|nr:hypothetical protein [Gemmatimonadales bacterium]
MRRGLLIALALLVGCSDGSGGADAAGAARPLAALRQQGGVAGAESYLVVTRGGSATLIRQAAHPDTVAWIVPTSQRTQLQALVASPDFLRADSIYFPPKACCDRITTALTVYQEGKPPRTIRSLDGADRPGVVELTVGLLRQIIATGTAQ